MYEYWPISSAICLRDARFTLATVFLIPSLCAYRLIIIFSSSRPVREIQLSNVWIPSSINVSLSLPSAQITSISGKVSLRDMAFSLSISITLV